MPTSALNCFRAASLQSASKSKVNRFGYPMIRGSMRLVWCFTMEAHNRKNCVACSSHTETLADKTDMSGSVGHEIHKTAATQFRAEITEPRHKSKLAVAAEDVARSPALLLNDKQRRSIVSP